MSCVVRADPIWNAFSMELESILMDFFPIQWNVHENILILAVTTQQ